MCLDEHAGAANGISGVTTMVLMSIPTAFSSSTTLQSGGRQLLSMVLPAYNEEEVLPQTYARFSAECPKFVELGLDYEIILVNDGSRDRTPAILDELAERDPHIRVVHLTRNFGHQAAISARPYCRPR